MVRTASENLQQSIYGIALIGGEENMYFCHARIKFGKKNHSALIYVNCKGRNKYALKCLLLSEHFKNIPFQL